MNNLSHNFVIADLLAPADQQAGVDSDSVHMGHLSLIAIMLHFGALTGDAVLKVYSGATVGAKTTAMTFRYRRAGADTKSDLNDQKQAELTSAALTLTAADYNLTQLEIEVRDSEMTVDEPWLTVEIGNQASDVIIGISMVGVPVHKGEEMPSVFA